MQIHSIGEILASESKIYLTGILYLFARYFASIEAIFSTFLRELIREIDTSGVITPLN